MLLVMRPGVSSGRTVPGRYLSSRLRLTNERGQALLETAITLPIVLFIAVSIFEFGRGYHTLQVVTNAAREGARIAVLPSTTPADVQSRVVNYLRDGQLANAATTTVTVNRTATVSIGTGTASASMVTVSYPFSFMVINPVANLVVRGSTLGSAPFTINARAQMRNEAQ
jgi:Flp pilus assembly protein TadG